MEEISAEFLVQGGLRLEIFVKIRGMKLGVVEIDGVRVSKICGRGICGDRRGRWERNQESEDREGENVERLNNGAMKNETEERGEDRTWD